MVVKRLLSQPATRGLDLDAPETTTIRKEIVSSKPFLRSIYEEWYQMLVDQLPAVDGRVLEIGAGGGFLDEILPEVITTEVFFVPGVDAVADAQALPVRASSLRGLLMTNVLHHIPQVDLFLSEAERVLVPGGRIVMIEPWNTAWSRFVHRFLHHESMRPEAETWAFPSAGPLSSANAALPWIIARRDREVVERRWALDILTTRPFMPFRYVMSGGVSMRSLMPGWTFRFWRSFERWTLTDEGMAVFALVVIERRDDGPNMP